MPAFKLLGKNYQTQDLVAKVTGKAKYAEDFRGEGMVFVKLMPSPRPHARVVSVDASAALAMPGVHAILRAERHAQGPAASGAARNRRCRRSRGWWRAAPRGRHCACARRILPRPRRTPALVPPSPVARIARPLPPLPAPRRPECRIHRRLRPRPRVRRCRPNTR